MPNDNSVVRGFAKCKDEVDWLKKNALTDKAIWLDGRGAENLEECIASFRSRPGQIVIARDLRAFGETKRDVAAAMAKLEKAKIEVVDLAHPDDTTVSEMLHRASVAISGYRLRDRRTARKRGREGGLANGVAAQESRSGIAPDWLVRNIVAEQSIAWKVKVRVLAGRFSEATLRRRYMVPA